MIEVLIYTPLVLACFILLFKKRNPVVWILPAWSVIQTLLIVIIFSGYESNLMGITDKYFGADKLTCFFLIITGILYVGSSFHSIDVLKKSSGKERVFYNVNTLIFVFAINSLLMSKHIGMMWVFIEATTLTGALLIYYEKKHSSIEAAWKYIFICSVGVAFAFIGIIFLSASSPESIGLFFSDMNANAGSMNKLWLKFGYTFAVIGFGTKMGLAPVHSWLPDAHSEAPWPVSALLSGALLNGAFLAIIKLTKIADIAGLSSFSGKILLMMGLFSVLIAAVFIQKTKNYKRLLAYSSIENMGILALCLYAGPSAYFAALFHAAGHSLTKASLFLTSGNIYRRFHSKDLFRVSGLMGVDRISALIWIISFFCIIASPPGMLFISEFLLFKTLIARGDYLLVIILFVLISSVVYGASFALLKICSGEPPEDVQKEKLKVRNYLPQIGFLVIVLFLGVYLPDSLKKIIDDAVLLMR